MVAIDLFAALNSYDFFNQYCSNLLKNPTVRGLIGERAKRVRHPLSLPIKKMFGRKYIKTTMRMLTILREVEE